MTPRAFRKGVWILAALAGCLAPAEAQVGARLAAGARVRVTAPSWHSERLVGSLRATTGDTLLLDSIEVNGQPAWLNETLRIPLDALTRLEVSRGRHRRTVYGASVGFMVGAGVGGVLGALQVGLSCPSSGCETSPFASGVIGAMLLGPVGALLGLGIGASTTTETWTQVPLATIGRIPKGVGG